MEGPTSSHRLSRGDTIALATLLVAFLGLAVVALPPAYPSLSPLLWQMVFWASLAGAAMSVLFLAYHHLTLPVRVRGLRQGSVAWRFEETGDALHLEWVLERVGAPLKFFVPGFVFSGKNVSGGPLYRPDAFVTVEHSNKVVPLYITSDGQWIEFSEAKEIPSDAEFQIGCQMRGDTLHCAEWTERLTPEQFLQDVGGFKLTFSHDGAPSRYWRFSTEEIGRQFERQKRAADALVRKMHPPTVERRD